jgi:hypothetical protein
MNEMIAWMNSNNGFVMVVLTFVYVIATIFICVFNGKSASATRRQTEEAQRQFEENNRAHVIPRFVTLEGQLYCLAFHNIGKTMAEKFNKIIYIFLTIFLYLLKCPQSLILSALRAFCFCGKPHISRSIFLYFRYQAWLKSW